MRWTEPFKYVAGSIVIYYAMAACSSGGASSQDPRATAPGGGSGSGTSNGSGNGGGGSGTGTGGSSSGNGGSGSPVPDANADQPQSGSRLKAVYYVGSDGSKQFAYWQDGARNGEQCAYQTAADGVVRCLPSGAYTNIYFGNATCTTPLVEVATTCGAPKYALTYVLETPGCAMNKVSVAPVEGAFSGSLYYKSGTTCMAYPSPPVGYAFYVVGAEIPAASFQDAHAE